MTHKHISYETLVVIFSVSYKDSLQFSLLYLIRIVIVIFSSQSLLIIYSIMVHKSFSNRFLLFLVEVYQSLLV
jgi:hypothetical protein